MTLGFLLGKKTEVFAAWSFYTILYHTQGTVQNQGSLSLLEGTKTCLRATRKIPFLPKEASLKLQ